MGNLVSYLRDAVVGGGGKVKRGKEEAAVEPCRGVDLRIGQKRIREQAQLLAFEDEGSEDEGGNAKRHRPVEVEVESVEEEDDVLELVTFRSVFKDRYEYFDDLYEGSFGWAVRVYDNAVEDYAVVKISKRNANKQDWMREAKILRKIGADRDEDKKYFVKITDLFVYELRYCLVFEFIETDLAMHSKQMRWNGGMLNEAVIIGFQLVEALQFLKRFGIIHGSIKPANIMLYNTPMLDLKLGDFGKACKENSIVKEEDLNTRYFYQAPEVMLKVRSTIAADMWSVGCVLAELLLGGPLFKGVNREDYFYKVVEVLGIPPFKLLKSSLETSKYFVLDEEDFYSAKDPVLNKFITGGPITLFTKLTNSTYKVYYVNAPYYDHDNLGLMFDLILRMVHYDPEKRIDADIAWAHDIFGNQRQQNAYKRARARARSLNTQAQQGLSPEISGFLASFSLPGTPGSVGQPESLQENVYSEPQRTPSGLPFEDAFSSLSVSEASSDEASPLLLELPQASVSTQRCMSVTGEQSGMVRESAHRARSRLTGRFVSLAQPKSPLKNNKLRSTRKSVFGTNFKASRKSDTVSEPTPGCSTEASANLYQSCLLSATPARSSNERTRRPMRISFRKSNDKQT